MNIVGIQWALCIIIRCAKKKKIYSDCDYIKHKNYWNPIDTVIYLHELHYTLVYLSTPSVGGTMNDSTNTLQILSQ